MGTLLVTSTVTCWPANGQCPGRHGGAMRGGTSSPAFTTLVLEPAGRESVSAAHAAPVQQAQTRGSSSRQML